MKQYSGNGRWWTLAGWTAASVALASAALAASVTPTTLTLVALFGALMLLLQLRWQSAAARATDERERTLALLRETLETTADGFLLLDLEGRVVSFNQKLVDMSGLSAEYFADGILDNLIAWMLERVVDPEAFLRRLEELGGIPDVEARDEFRFHDGRIFERYTRPHRVLGRTAGRVWSFRDVTSERRALCEIAERDRILEAVSFAAERFLRTGDWQRDLDDALAQIGAAAGATRAYLFSNSRAADGSVLVSQRGEWTAEGVKPGLEHRSMQEVRLGDLGLQSCEGSLRRNEAVHELVRCLPESGRRRLEGQGIRSVLLIPIFIGSSWWGFLGFDDSVREREWSQTLRDVLMAAGRMIGAGIQRQQAEEALRRANRIEAIGHLAAGIAHEINTPIQYVGDNLRFLDESYTEIGRAIEELRELLREVSVGAVTADRLHELTAVVDNTDLDYLLREAPRASSQALDGVQRVAEIVRAMREFSHPGSGLKVPTDLNHAILSTATVARNEWKYVAELETSFEESLPPVLCLPGELNQAILNLVINAAHAIGDRQRSEGSDRPGRITISTALTGDMVEIQVRDTGTGIPAEIRPRIFDPFFTTKEVGRGTGQGLTFVHSIVVEKHGGTVAFDTEVGVGTTFIIRLPHLSETPRIEVAA